MQTFHQPQSNEQFPIDTAHNSSESGIPLNEGILSSAIIRIVSGSSQGTEAKFHDSIYTIGSDDSCDIVLKSDGVKPVHLLALNEDNEITIIEKDGVANVNDQPIQDGEHEVSQGAIVSIGSAKFQVFLNGTPVTPYVVRKIHFQGGYEDERHNDEKPEIDKASIATEGVAIDPKQKLIDRKSTLAKGRVRACLAFFCVIALLYGMYAFIPEPELKEPVDPVEQILIVFDRLNAPRPVVKQLHQGAFEVTGYVQTIPKKKKIVDNLKKLSMLSDARIFCMEEIEGLCRQVILQMDWLLEVEPIGVGKIRLTGFVSQGQDIDVIAEQLSQDVAGIRSIEKRVWPLNDVLAKIGQHLQAVKLHTKIEAKPLPGNISTIGTIDTSEKPKWEKVKGLIQANFGKELVINDNIQVVENSFGKISLPITAVTMGETPNITFKGGRKYFVGSSLKNGNLIKKISEEQIIMAIDGKEYVYPIGKLAPQDHPTEKIESERVYDEKKDTSDKKKTLSSQTSVSNNIAMTKPAFGKAVSLGKSEKRNKTFHKTPNKKLNGKSKNRKDKTATSKIAQLKISSLPGNTQSAIKVEDHGRKKESNVSVMALPDKVKTRFETLIQEGIDSLVATHIFNAAQYYDLNPYVIAAVIKVESGFNSKAISSRGAKGLMQIMPANFTHLGLKDAFDPGQNIMAGTRYLKEQLTEFNGNIALALAAYNAGPSSVYKYKGVPPYSETRDYIRSVLKQYHHYKISDGS